jgi:NitT/TauT family transport system ATP-binding protein
VTSAPGAQREAATGAAAVRFDDVAVRFTTRRKTTDAVSGVSLAVAPGEFVSVLGPSGCGKSTLLKVAAGLVRPSRGRAELLGNQVNGPQRDIGFVFQRAALLEWRSTRGNIMLQAEIRGMDKREAERRAGELMELTGLRGFETSYPHELSGGMQQRVSLCRALLHRPRVLLMDEPFGALDALTREQMNVELHRIWRETGTSVLFVTHSIPEAFYLANRVVVMTARPGTIAEIFPVDLPAHRDYAQTMSSSVLADLGGRARALLGASAHTE